MINNKDFDYHFYIHLYPDLKKNNINNYQKAFIHLKNSGLKEDRYYSFNHSEIYYKYSWLLYLRNNKDLNGIVNSEFDAFNHYMIYGKKEKRKLYKLNVIIKNFNWDLFDFNFYIQINNLNLKTKNESINHFTNIGYKLNLLHDLKHSNLYFHYDWDKYISDNDDLENFDIKKAFFHYIEYGEKEKRKIYKKDDIDSKLENFNWKFYLIANNDLINNNVSDKKKAIIHFKSNGYKEDRLYSNYHNLLYINYDWEKYSKTYKLNKNNLDAFKHYVHVGFYEKHKINYSINQKKFYKDFFIEFNNLNHLESFDECKKYYLKLELKVPYSYEHFLLFNLFDWDKIYNNNLDYFNTQQINNSKNLFIEVINNYKKFRLKFFLNDNLTKITDSVNIDNIFINLSFIQELINKNLIFNESSFLNKLFEYQKKLNNLVSYNFHFIKIPPGFNFDEFKYENENLKFCFVISSFNNEDNIYNNLLSIIYQNYQNWKIYYTNDCSTDNTDELFHKIINEFNLKDKIYYIKNEKNMKQSYCKNYSYKLLKNNDIVCILDGDDWLSTNNALSLLANEYNNSNNLVIYSGYHVYYENKIDKSVYGSEYPSEIKEKGEYRKYKSWLFTHLKTGYAWLFKKIPENYLKKNDKWLDRCTDLAEMYSVSEMAGTKVKHLKKILYVYNKKNSIKYDNSYYNDHSSKTRKDIENYVKNLKPLSIIIPKIFIINLKNRSDLKDKIYEQLSYYNISNFEFFEAYNGYTNKIIKEKYDEYNLKYDNNIISNITLGVTKKHINSLGALGVIYSTIELFKKINKNTNLDHVIILEDDVYFHKKFDVLYNLLKLDLQNKDYIYLGFNSTSIELNTIFNKNKDNNLIEIEKNHYYDGGIYGAYSYICSRKYREYVISLDIEYYINNNINLDAALNIFFSNKEKQHIKNDLNFYIFNDHLFISEVRKNGINNIRNDNYYKERFINLDNYLI